MHTYKPVAPQITTGEARLRSLHISLPRLQSARPRPRKSGGQDRLRHPRNNKETNDPRIVLAFLGASALFFNTSVGLGLITMQDIVPNWLHGQASAIFLFAINLIGLGLGPTAVVLVTDKVFKNDLALASSTL